MAKNIKYYYSKDPFLRLYQLYRRSGAALHRARRKELRRYRLSDSETAVLDFVHAARNMITPAELARQMVHDDHAISQLTARMEKRGLLKKNKDLPSTNMVRISLTETGEQMYLQTRTIQSIRDIFSSLSSEDREQLASFLNKLWDKASRIDE